MNRFGDQLKQETCNREHAMSNMEARWQASQAKFGTDLEAKMEQRLKAAMGDLAKGAPINYEEDDRHRTEVFLSKLTPDPKVSMQARIKLWLEGASIHYKDVKVLRENATFAFICFRTESERDAALGQMTASIESGMGA